MIATYRLQLTADFGFDDALELVPYLKALGISHLYLSPSLEARAGSMHGYDVIDPARISEEKGGEEAFRRLCAAGLSVLLDIVPNHMAACDDNPWWADEEERARVFDIDPATGRWRRFFDIDELAGVRVEDEEVFDRTHAKILQLVDEGLVEGLRIDHPDGLTDPTGYLERLRARGARHVWVEKIFEVGERRRDWPIEGTVGYEFLNEAQALFVERSAEESLTDLYATFTGELRSFHDVAYEAKLEQATTTFDPEVARLRSLVDLPELPQTLASFPVYRTYVEPWHDRVYEADRVAIEGAQLSDQLRRVLLLEERGHDEFVSRFQQVTGPVMAKGVEDTAFYRYNRLLALNEVGGEPSRFGIGVEELHERNIDRAARMPRSLLATSTHDTKRSGDVRARIGALTRAPEEWRETVLRWRDLNADLKQDAPSPNEEYFLYQTLVGTWPIEPERLERYLEKALREAKTTTSWLEPNAEWERGVHRFARALYDHEPFVADLERFVARVRELARPSILGQTLLKLTAPGVPDIYWGDELEELSLVDPDNRRPVDWARRRDALAALEAGATPTEASEKLYVIREALALRARRPHAFGGAYRPFETDPRVFAFTRGEDEVFVAVANDELDDYEPPPGHWRDVLPLGGFTTVRLLELAA